MRFGYWLLTLTIWKLTTQIKNNTDNGKKKEAALSYAYLTHTVNSYTCGNFSLNFGSQDLSRIRITEHLLKSLWPISPRYRTFSVENSYLQELNLIALARNFKHSFTSVPVHKILSKKKDFSWPRGGGNVFLKLKKKLISRMFSKLIGEDPLETDLLIICSNFI